jgi:hypothetical protein
MIAKQKIHKANNFMGAFDYNDQKLNHKDPKQRAELLDHNFIRYDREAVSKEVSFLQQLRPKLTRDAYHVSLNFAAEDKLINKQLITIAQEYLRGMGFDNNLYSIWKHHDADHLHIHALASRIRYDGSVVSDSNNYKRSEALCRRLEQKYGLAVVRSSEEAEERAPNKDELEMVQRTGKPSDRMLMQERVKLAVAKSNSIESFIKKCQEQGIYLLFNQSKSTGRVSGITYVMDNGFQAKGQKLGNMYKWKNILNTIRYEQGTDSKAISEANSRTRARFADLLSQGDERDQNRDGRVDQRAKSDSTESTNHSRGDQRTESRGDEPEPNSNSTGAFGSEEGVSENEKADCDLLSNGASTAIGHLSGFVGGASANDVDDDELKRKRRRKR